MIRYLLDVPEQAHGRSSFAMRLLLESEGVVASETRDLREADLVYGPPSAEAPGYALHVVASVLDWEDPALNVGLHEGSPVFTTQPEATVDPLPLAYFLACGVHERAGERNELGVPVARTSALWRGGLLQRPVVQQLAGQLRKELELAVGRRERRLDIVPRWPDGHQYAVLLTHDVDRPLSRPPAAHYYARMIRGVREARPGLLARAAGGWIRNVIVAGDSGADPQRDPQFGFDDWMQFASTIGARPAFFVAVRGSADRYGHPRDVYYDASHPAIVAALGRLVDGGCEIALHASIACRTTPGLLAEERAKLSGLLGGRPIRGVRHHYWALDVDRPHITLAEHAAAGFSYDSSLGLNDAAGFRRGTALPFFPFDPDRDREIASLQLPPTAMDAAIFHYGSCDAIELDAHLDTVRDVGGCAVLNWHLAQAMPARMGGAGPALRAVLERRVRSADNLWLASPSELTDWWIRRRARVFPLGTDFR